MGAERREAPGGDDRTRVPTPRRNSPVNNPRPRSLHPPSGPPRRAVPRIPRTRARIETERRRRRKERGVKKKKKKKKKKKREKNLTSRAPPSAAAAAAPSPVCVPLLTGYPGSAALREEGERGGGGRGGFRACSCCGLHLRCVRPRRPRPRTLGWAAWRGVAWRRVRGYPRAPAWTRCTGRRSLVLFAW